MLVFFNLVKVNTMRLFIFFHKKQIRVIALLTLIFLFSSCSKYKENKRLIELTEDFLKQYFEFYPVQATTMRNQNYNEHLDNYSSEKINKMIRTIRIFLKKISLIDTKKLNYTNEINFIILSSKLKLLQFELERWKRWENNATLYTQTIRNALMGLALHCQDTTINCTENLIARLKQAPYFLNQGKSNLQQLNSIDLSTAVENIENLKKMIAFRLSEKFLISPSYIDTLNQQSEIVLDSLESFKKFLESKKNRAIAMSLSLTPEMYETYINLILNEKIDLDKLISWIDSDYQRYYDDILKISESYFNENGKSKRSYKFNNLVEQINDEIEKQSLNKDEIIPYCYETIEEIKRFIDEIWNLSLPINYSIQIEWSEDDIINSLKLAHLAKIGLLEPEPKFYCLIKPISSEGDWIQQLSLLREYNKPYLKILMMLEAIVGHYQIWLEELDKIPILARAFPDKVLINGWQYYCAFSILNAGFGGYNPELRYLLLRDYIRILLMAKVEIQYYQQQSSIQQMEGVLLTSKLFKRNEIEAVVSQIVTSPGLSLIIYRGVKELNELEIICRDLLGPQFDLNIFFLRILNQGPIPLKLAKQKVIDQFQKDKITK